MSPPTTNLRVLGVRPLISPAILCEELPLTPAAERTIGSAGAGKANTGDELDMGPPDEAGHESGPRRSQGIPLL